MNTSFPVCLVLVGVGVWTACSTGEGGGFVPGSGSASGGASSIFTSGGSGSTTGVSTSGPLIDVIGKPPTPKCGDGVLDEDEACDDGNRNSGDGCLDNCRGVEVGYSCVPAGEPCRQIARCGDGVMMFPELCDDGNKKNGDGCSASCKYEVGYKCSGTPSKCTPTTCGDGIIEGAESCEDGNALPFDGCSADCQHEPKCGEGPCRSTCGDGIVLDEACDDGNNINGDGCSADCTEEPGFTCRQPELGDSMQVPAVFRDFKFHNPTDFEPGATGRTDALPGIAANELDQDGKPVYSGLTGANVASKESFASWYRDVPGTNSTTVGKLTLWNSGSGAYVNRWGEDGKQWTKVKLLNWCGSPKDAKVDDNGDIIPCTSKFGTTECDGAVGEILECYIDEESGSYKALELVERVDGNPLFFPVDADPFSPADERLVAKIAEKIYASWWTEEPGNPPPKHNFSFTSQAGYWFQFDATKTYKLEFLGDDDVWVFVNRKLAVDLGGIHGPVTGSVTLDAASASSFGLENGKVYEIMVFHAERQRDASSYKLTLSGFNAAASDCTPFCGDGIVGIGEECDDGKNDGGYGQCGAGCRLGEYCGDGIQQAGEDCDDGINIGSPCQSGCRHIILL
ncbi:MAG TPA: DUF4215 domain-containing protein [Polyangiaceae bacterium]|nr:DUF4215 domain-containing protein [Polyangiaceae bacterium]